MVTFDHEILLESISRLFCSSEELLDTWPQDEPFSTPENTYLRWMRTGDSILILMSKETGWIETATVHQRRGVPCPTSSPALPRTQLTDLSALPADLSEASLPISCHSDLLACNSSGFCSFYCLLTAFLLTCKTSVLEKEMATHSGVLAWRISQTGFLAGYAPRSQGLDAAQGLNQGFSSQVTHLLLLCLCRKYLFLVSGLWFCPLW